MPGMRQNHQGTLRATKEPRQDSHGGPPDWIGPLPHQPTQSAGASGGKADGPLGSIGLPTWPDVADSAVNSVVDSAVDSVVDSAVDSAVDFDIFMTNLAK